MMLLLLGGVLSHPNICNGAYNRMYKSLSNSIFFFSLQLFIQNNIFEFIHVKNYDRNTNKNQYGKYIMEIVVMMYYEMKRIWWFPLRQHEREKKIWIEI